MSEPVQVYTACQFARLPNLGFRKQYLRVFNLDWKKGLAQYMVQNTKTLIIVTMKKQKKV